MEQSSAATLDGLRTGIIAGDFEQVDDAWMELAGDASAVLSQLGDLLGIVELLVSLGQSQRALSFSELLLPAIEGGGPETPESVRLRGLLSELSDERDYLTKFVTAFRDLYSATSAERAYLEVVNLEESSDLTKSLARLRGLMNYQVGAVVFHESGWGIGEVKEVDALLKVVVVDLEEKKDHRMNIAVIDQVLEFVPAESFRAMKYRDPESLKALADSDPGDLFTKVLEAYGNNKPLKDVKSKLVPDIIATGSWAKWWAAAKKGMRESGFFRIGDRSPYKIERLAKQVSYEDELLERFDSGKWVDRLAASRMVVKGGEKKYPEIFARVMEELKRLATEEGAAEMAANAERGTARADKSKATEQALLSGILLTRAGVDEGAAALDSALSRLDEESIVGCLAKLSQSDEIRAGLDAQVKLSENPDAFLRAAFLAKSDSLRDVVVDIVKADKEKLSKLVLELSGAPRLGPEAACWLFERRIAAAEDDPVMEPLASLTDRELLGRIMDLVEHMIDRGARSKSITVVKDVFRRLELLLWTKRGKFFAQAVNGLPVARLERLNSRLLASADYFAKHGSKLIEIVSVALPEVEGDEDKWWSDESLYTTSVGLAKRREEFKEITDEKLPAIFDAIGRAREFGDLSENAEYTSALEERDLLTKRATAIEEELKRAVVIEPEDVRPDVVGLGSHVRLLDQESNEEIVYSVLGPWDGHPDDGVLSYLSPLGEFFLGHREGDEFVAELPGGAKKYKVLEITSHFS